MTPSAGMPAPGFTLLDQDGDKRSLSDYRGSWVLLYFYPKDETPGCIKEACGLRDRASAYKGKGITVLGINGDTVESHRKFADKYDLPFRLLSDPGKEAIDAYGVWREKELMGKTYMGITRTSFVIDPAGVIRSVYEDVDPQTHAHEVLQDIETLKKVA